MKNTILFFILFFSSLIVTAHAQIEKKILILDAQSQEPYKSLRLSVINELSKLGYKKGKNLIIDYDVLGNYEGKGFNLLRIVKQNNLKYNVIFLNGTISGQAAITFLKKYKLNSFNFIFGNITDPVGLGLVDKLNVKNNKNITGIAYPVRVETRLRFIQNIFGKKVKVGFIYADMPQSRSYNKWLKAALNKKEFSQMNFMFHKVDFVKGNKGHKRMVWLAEKVAKKIEKDVDIFVCSHDQLGISVEFSRMIYELSNKPLVGVASQQGAAVAIISNTEKTGKKLARMIVQVFKGKKPIDIIPGNSEYSYYIDRKICKHLQIKVPKYIINEIKK